LTQINIVKRNGAQEPLVIAKMRKVIEFACADYPECDPLELEMDAQIQFRDGMTTREIQRTITQVAVEKTSVAVPNWQFVAARLLAYDLYKEAAINRGYRGKFGYGGFYELITELADKGLYGDYMRAYSFADIEELGAYIKPERDELFNYIGIKTLSDRYLVRDYDGSIMELPQERFMIIAMHLALKEQMRLYWAKQFYDVLSRLEMTVATPTLANAGRPHHQLSSCFIDTVGDSLWSIYNTDAAFAQVSKHGGGMGIYASSVRARNSAIRGHKGASGGVIPWIRNYNNTAIAVDQLGVRSGAVAIYLDVWHADILDFLNLKTNNGDDRMKAHDVFPGVCIPDIFMRAVKEREMWYLFDPHEVRETMEYSLEDAYDEAEGGEFTRRYRECVTNTELSRTEIPAIDVMKRIMTSAFETGTPFIFYRDTVNRANPNKHAGMIYSSNLC
jgi:ribonucleoside-diphosphate reductase alpha chain